MVADASSRLVCPQCGAIYRTDFEACALDGHALEPLTDDPLVGKVIADRYRIEACISEGAMGRVYRATHTRMSKRFAVKVLFGEHASQTRMRARFSREAEAASRLEHPNLVSVVDFGETPERLLYLVMDFIDGRTCGGIIAEEGPLDELRALRLVREIARGLRHLHAREMVHRDLKLDNVIVATDGDVEVPKIVDLGVAILPSDGTVQEKLTKQGTIVGTPAFMAPEQAFGDGVDPRSDVFSLGMVLYHLLAGRGPFDGSAVEVIQQNVTVPFPPIAERAPGRNVSRDAQRILDRMIEKHAEDRFDSAQAVIDAIDRVRPPSVPAGRSALVSHAELTADLSEPALTEPQRSGGPKRSLRAVYVAAACGLVAALAVGGWAIRSRTPEPEPVAELTAGAVYEEPYEDEEEAAEVTEEVEEPEDEVAPKKKTRRKRRARRKRRRTVRRTKLAPLEKEDGPKTRTAPTVAELSALTKECSTLIQRIEDRAGPVEAGPLRVRLMGLAATESTPPDQRHHIERRLKRLRRELRRRL